MRTSIDRAGRLVIPKPLRERLGLRPGEVEITESGNGLHLEPVVGQGLVREGRWLVVPHSGESVTDIGIRDLRDADQK